VRKTRKQQTAIKIVLELFNIVFFMCSTFSPAVFKCFLLHPWRRSYQPFRLVILLLLLLVVVVVVVVYFYSARLCDVANDLDDIFIAVRCLPVQRVEHIEVRARSGEYGGWCGSLKMHWWTTVMAMVDVCACVCGCIDVMKQHTLSQFFSV